MRRSGRGVIFIFPGTFRRLGPHVGALKALHEHGLAIADKILCISSGALMVAATAGGTDKKSIKKTEEIVGNLRSNQICEYRQDLVFSFRSVVVAFASAYLIALLSRMMPAWLFGIVGTVTFIVLAYSLFRFGKNIYVHRAPLSTRPLNKLLSEALDFKANFKSSTEINIFTTDMETGENVVFSNRDPLSCDPANPEHRGRYIKALLASSAIPLFEHQTIDGRHLADGEFSSDLPYEKVEGYHRVVVFDYWPGAGVTYRPLPSTIIGYQDRVIEVLRDRRGVMKEELYDLNIRRWNPELPEPLHVKASAELMQRMPLVALDAFTPDEMKQSIQVGYDIVIENLPRIKAYLGRQ